MPAYVEVIGNLLQNPEQRIVKVKGEDRKITEIRVFSDVYKKDTAGNLIQDNTKSAPYNVTLWNERMAEEVMKHLRKGCRVRVEGELTVQQWQDKETEENKFGMHIDAESCDLRLNRIDEIRFRPKRTIEDAEGDDPGFASDDAYGAEAQKTFSSRKEKAASRNNRIA